MTKRVMLGGSRYVTGFAPSTPNAMPPDGSSESDATKDPAASDNGRRRGRRGGRGRGGRGSGSSDATS